MKKLILILMAATFAVNSANAEANPLLKPFTGVHGAPNFSEIKNEHYLPAFKEAIRLTYLDIEKIVNNPQPATFANTIEALEFSGADFSRIAGVFYALNESNTNPEMQELALELSPLTTALSNDINLNPTLFARVKTVYEKRKSLDLNKEQVQLLEKTYKRFSRNGAALSDNDKETYRKITTELSKLSLNFKQNSLAATNAYTLHITDPKLVAELPDFIKEGAKSEAKNLNLEGWVITLQAPSMIPFMTYSSNRELKEQVWRAYNSRSFGGKFDNSQTVKDIATNRLKLANLLGYNTYADYILEERMAESADAVNGFLDELLGRSVDAARIEVKEVEDFAAQQGAKEKLQPWDFGYYSEKLKDAKYSISEELTKPYFQLEKAQQGIFDLAGKLYGITFKENPEIEVYHPDVKAYEVFDKNGKFLALFYMDFFPRASKRSGAWMTDFRGQSVRDGVEVRPLVSVVTNFTKPTENTPSLLTFDEVNTLLHEFGHALHGIFADGSYESLTGTAVYRDFVELPSQIMENWATEKEFLDLWAAHYQTGEKIPAELVRKIIDAKNYLAAYTHTRQVSYGLGDMAWHSITAPVEESVNDFERNSIAKAQILPYIDGQCMATAFTHIFSGGYAAGYYSYKWAEVLEADAFSLFKKKGIFNKEVAESFRKNILSKGGTEHPMTLYINYRGHKPNTQALFDKMGIK